MHTAENVPEQYGPKAKLLTTDEVAERLAVWPSTVVSYIRRGKLPARDIRGGASSEARPLYRVSEPDLIGYIEGLPKVQPDR